MNADAVSLRRMVPSDLQALSFLAIRSKASWGYDDVEMEVFSQELTLTVRQLESLADAQVATIDGRIVGFVTLRLHEDDTLELEHLFVDPECFGVGVGTRLLRSAIAAARNFGACKLTIISDPNSVGFYQRYGGQIVGSHDSSIPGRAIPVMELTL